VSLRVTASFHIGFSPQELERVGPKNLGEGSTRQLVIWLHWLQGGYTCRKYAVTKVKTLNSLSGRNKIVYHCGVVTVVTPKPNNFQFKKFQNLQLPPIV